MIFYIIYKYLFLLYRYSFLLMIFIKSFLSNRFELHLVQKWLHHVEMSPFVDGVSESKSSKPRRVLRRRRSKQQISWWCCPNQTASLHASSWEEVCAHKSILPVHVECIYVCETLELSFNFSEQSIIYPPGLCFSSLLRYQA